MVKTLFFFFQRFKTPALDQMIIEDEIRAANISRCRVITGIYLPIALIIHFYFSYGNFTGKPGAENWVDGYLTLNLYIGSISLVLFLTAFWLKKTQNEQGLLSAVLPHFVFLLFAIGGATCSIYDQTLNNSITSFLLACLLNAAVLLIRPLHLFIYLSTIYSGFCYGLYLTQNDQSEMMLTIIDALCMVAVAYAIAWVFWKNNMTRFKQARLIKSQRLILVHQYEKLARSNEQLEVSNGKLEESNASKDQFFSILAHDLRGPLGSAMALTKFLGEGEFESDPEERQKMYMLLQNSLNNSAKLLENVLLWSTNQAGVLNFKPTLLNVYDTVQSSVEVLKIVASQKQIEVLNLIPKELSAYADSDMLHTIFRNLLSNAIKFTPNQGNVEVRSELLSNELDGKSMLKISVIDYGVGMSHKSLSNLFQIEKKMIGLGTNNESGTGLGLVLCKDFIEKHEGRINVESKENEGSKFMITLPCLN